jgi:hypothetical protein
MGRRIAVVFILFVAVCALGSARYRPAPATLATPAGRLVGSLRDSETGAPLAGEVAVSLVAGRQITLSHATASPAGEYSSEGLAAGSYHLTTKLDGYAPEHASVSIGEGETGRVDFRLKRVKLVRGVVYAPSGAPLADARVRLVYRADPAAPGHFTSTYQWETADFKTDLQGRFALAAHPDKEFVVEALHTDFAGAVSAPTRLKPGQREATINLKLGRAVGVTGEVKDGRGNPVPGAQVMLRELGDRPAPAEFATSEVVARRSRATISDGVGSFSFKQVTPARQMMVVVHPSYKVFRQVVNPADAKSPHALTITLEDKL